MYRRQAQRKSFTAALAVGLTRRNLDLTAICQRLTDNGTTAPSKPGSKNFGAVVGAPSVNPLSDRPYAKGTTAPSFSGIWRSCPHSLERVALKQLWSLGTFESVDLINFRFSMSVGSKRGSSS